MSGSVATDPSDRAGHDRPALARWWDGLGRGQQVLAAVVAVALLVNLVLAGARSLLGGDPGGPVSSSFSTGGDGLEGYADLLRAEGHPVTRLRSTVTDDDLPTGATAVVVDPEDLTATDAERLARFVSRGGRLVLGGEASGQLLAGLTGTPVRWRQGDRVERLRVWLPVDGTGSAREMAGDDGGRWADVGSLLPVAGSDSGPAIVVADVGDGRVVALADTRPLQNDALGQADNAALALAAAGDEDRPVVFVESVHGFAASGLDAVPSSWKWAAAGLGVALLAGLWSAGARVGPPEEAGRALRPRRRGHVDAVAAGLDRVTPSPAETVAPLVAASRSALVEQLGLPPDASPGVLHAAAERGAIDPRVVDLLVEPVGDLDRALAVGALAARRQRARHRLPEPPDRPTAAARTAARTTAAAPDPPGARP